MNWLCVGTGDIVTKRAADALATADKSQLVGICGGRGRAQIIANEHNAPPVSYTHLTLPTILRV